MYDRFLTQFRAARLAGTPLVAVVTSDPGASTERLRAASAATTPAIAWDVCRGWRALNEAGRDAIVLAVGDADVQAATGNPVEMLMSAAPALPDKAVLYLFNAHRYLADNTASGAAFVQALWNLRDAYKATQRTAVLLGPQITLPSELANDVVLLDEPLPDDAAVGQTVEKLASENDVPLTSEARAQAVDALRGLPLFSVEQATAMAVTGARGQRTLNVGDLWERKMRMISQTPGLSVWRGAERFDDVGGNAQVKWYLSALMRGRDPFRVVVFFDEIEKQLAGAQGDNTGVTQAQHGQLLTYMQDRNVNGLRFIGPPGAGKSAVAKAIGGEADVLTIVVDLGTSKASLVGESEARLAQILRVIDAVGGGQALFVATCNRDAVLSPELRRRFATTFYFDLPDEAERDTIWPIWQRKLGLDTREARPTDRNWTGAEIRQACLLSYRLAIPLRETAQFIVPVAVAAREEIEALRRQADGKFLSASYAGPYRLKGALGDASAAPPKARRLAREEV